MDETSPLVFVDLIKDGPLRAVLRPQRWRWVARNGNNNRILARSSERYTNESDCGSAIFQLFGDGSNVYLRMSERGNSVLRLAVEQ